MFLFVCWLFHPVFFKPVSGVAPLIGLYLEAEASGIYDVPSQRRTIHLNSNEIMVVNPFSFSSLQPWKEEMKFVSSSLFSTMLRLLTRAPSGFFLLLLHNYKVTKFGGQNLSHKDLQILAVQTCQLREQPAAAVAALHAYKRSQKRFRIIQSDWF